MKVVLTNPTSFVSDASAVAQTTTNHLALEAAIENTLSRDGTGPNSMGADFDMNGHRVLNLPQPMSDSEPARLVDIGNAFQYTQDAAASAAEALADRLLADADVVLTHADVVTTHADVVLANASAAEAQGYVAGLSGASTSSVLIGTGAKSFTVTTGKLWAAGQFITLVSAANSANYMHGTVTSYSGVSGALVANILDIGGSGTLADWNITISGTQGPIGLTGNTGPAGATGISGTPTANQFATFNNATTIQGVALTGLVKGNGASAPTAAIANTDYLAPAAIGVTVQAYDATAVNAAAIANTKIDAIQFVIDGGGLTITTGVKGYLEIPFACTINRASLFADQSGSIVVDVWKDTNANFPPVVGDKITASAPPTISAATKSQDSTLTGWTTAVAAGDILAFNVNSVTTCQRVTISLKVTKT